MLQKGKVQQVTLGAKTLPEIGLAVDRAVLANRTTMTTRSDFVRIAVQRYLRDLGFAGNDLTEGLVNQQSSGSATQETPKQHFWVKRKEKHS
jgi:hypothetical protein